MKKLFTSVCVLYNSCYIIQYASGFSQYIPLQPKHPQLILITGATGTGKSTFGMSVALHKGILKCISTDTLRQVKRTCGDKSPALHRSSYEGEVDPVVNWRECCTAIEDCVHSVVSDCIRRGVSLVLEGVHVVPSNTLIDIWSKGGGVGVGLVLQIENADTHRDLIYRRGELTKKGAENQVREFGRIRAIQNEMVRLGRQEGWAVIHENLQENPYTLLWEKIDKSNPSVPCILHPLALRL